MKVQVLQGLLYYLGTIMIFQTLSLEKSYASLTIVGISIRQYRLFVSYRTRFSQVFSDSIQLRQKDLRQSCVTL